MTRTGPGLSMPKLPPVAIGPRRGATSPGPPSSPPRLPASPLCSAADGGRSRRSRGPPAASATGTSADRDVVDHDDRTFVRANPGWRTTSSAGMSQPRAGRRRGVPESVRPRRLPRVRETDGRPASRKRRGSTIPTDLGFPAPTLIEERLPARPAPRQGRDWSAPTPCVKHRLPCVLPNRLCHEYHKLSQGDKLGD